MRTKKIIMLCSFIAILLGVCLLSACSESGNAGETAPSASIEVTPSAEPTAGLETGDPEGTEPGGDFSDLFDETTPTPTGKTETVAPTQSAAGTPTQKPTQNPTQQPTQSSAPATQTPAPTGGLSASTETPGLNWGPLS